MAAAAIPLTSAAIRDAVGAALDQRVILRGTFADYEGLLTLRGDHGGVRVYFLEGAIELMSSSFAHEEIKTTIARMVEAFADEHELEVNGFGSWTLKNGPKERGAEPDECYVIGAARKERPDLAIEIAWTRGGLDKLDIYRGLGVREVWMWEDGAVTIHVLRGDAYVAQATSDVLPSIDLPLLVSFLPADPTTSARSQSQTVRAYRAALRQPRPTSQ